MKEPIIRTHNREIDELFERYRRAPGSHVFAPLADAYRKIGLVEEALDICARGLSANPRYASGHVVQGKCEYDAGRVDRAEAAFKKVLEIDPNNLVALKYLGMIRAGCGDAEGARAHFEHILALDPGDKDIGRRLEAVRETGPATASTLVEEIEQVLEPQESPEAPRPTRAPPPASEPARPTPDDDVIELPDIRDDFEGTPIVLRDEAETSEYIATVTLADIFAAQGYHAKALKIYQDVLRRQPGNDEVRRKIATLEEGAHPAASATPEAAPYAEQPAPEPAAPSPSPAPAAPAPPRGTTIDEGRSYEQFKRWLRSVSD
jgi:tetratricopeptide (TPR) repeat protein